ncbi:MAG: GxxExxY protein [Burkholderiales bacterium]|nr:GxxExxY protein [Phycisphaerae bacterium]
MNADERRLNEVTESIIGCAFAVSNALGVGYLEKVYENSMLVELAHADLNAQAQRAIPVYYRETLVGQYFCDLLVEECIIVEIKHAKGIDEAHVAQVLNYLRATGFKIALIINFGKTRVEIRRVVSNL